MFKKIHTNNLYNNDGNNLCYNSDNHFGDWEFSSDYHLLRKQIDE